MHDNDQQPYVNPAYQAMYAGGEDSDSYAGLVYPPQMQNYQVVHPGHPRGCRLLSYISARTT